MPRPRPSRTVSRLPGTSTGAAEVSRRARLPFLLLTGILLIGAALGLRSSPWIREHLVRGKTLLQLEAEARRDPEDSITRYALAKQYYLARRFSDAEDAYRAVLAREPRSARAHLGLGLTLYERGRFSEAQDAFQKALKLDPKLAWAEYMLGKMAWLRGRIPEAIPHVKQAAELVPRSAVSWYALGVCYLQQRRYNEAVAPLQRAVALDDSTPAYRTALGEVLAYLGHSDEGRRHLERAVQLDSNYGPACAIMGNFYLRNAPEPDALARAEELLVRASHLRTYHPEQVYLDLGDLYLQKREYCKAAAALEKSIRLDPRDERPYFLLTRVQQRLGDPKAAERTQARFRRISKLHIEMQSLEARIHHNASDTSARLRLARVYRRIGLVSQAAAQYISYLRASPDAEGVAAEYQRWTAAGPSVPNQEGRSAVALSPFQ